MMIYVLLLIIAILAGYLCYQIRINGKKSNNHAENPVTVMAAPSGKPVPKKRPVEKVPSLPWEETHVITEEFQHIRELVCRGEKFILVTGGAGTGKTTLIQWLLEANVLPLTKIAVVSYTGIAALVCRGKTIHSFFSLPPSTLLPGTVFSNISSTRASLFRHLELLIIDEISMVRSDLMDGVDRRLRKARRSEEPFGGVPLLMVGDPCQLPPVVGPKERKLFSPVPGDEKFQLWESPWFFHAKVFSDRKMKGVLLTHTFRQQDGSREYLDHLNKMRALSLTNRNQQEVIEYFNAHCFHEGMPLLDQAITITFTNSQADEINAEHLRTLPGPEHQFTARATGYFAGQKSTESKNQFTPKLPAPYTLVIKEGAQVMILVNDPEKRYVNGSLATILHIRDEDIIVTLPGGLEVSLSPCEWVSEDFIYNKQTEGIERIIDGSYKQYPVTLAWAFTAHKSQGKTLDRVNIITDQRSFASGQTYVALSRTRRIEDMCLSAPLTPNNFVVDRELLRLREFLKSDSE